MMLIRSLRKHERDDTVRFWAERDASVYWRSLMISSLITSPIIFVAPEAYVVATLAGVALAFVNRQQFRLEMTSTHVRLKGAALIPSIYLGYEHIAEARVADVKPAEDGAAPVGTLVLKLATGPELRLTGIVDPAEAAAAFAKLKGEAAGTASRSPWADREAA
jgi:hypothetical protein